MCRGSRPSGQSPTSRGHHHDADGHRHQVGAVEQQPARYCRPHAAAGVDGGREAPQGWHHLRAVQSRMDCRGAVTHQLLLGSYMPLPSSLEASICSSVPGSASAPMLLMISAEAFSREATFSSGLTAYFRNPCIVTFSM